MNSCKKKIFFLKTQSGFKRFSQILKDEAKQNSKCCENFSNLHFSRSQKLVFFVILNFLNIKF